MDILVKYEMVYKNGNADEITQLAKKEEHDSIY